MRRRLVFAVSLGLAVVLSATPAVAQTTGSLQGTVRDADGGVLPGATVRVSSDALVAGALAGVTDTLGNYRFPSLPPGIYSIEASLSGFQSVRQENVRLQLGQALSVDVTLPLASLAEEITVVAEAGQVSVVSNTVSSNLDQDFLARQPLPRSFNALMAYAPGVNGLEAYGGTEANQNAYTLDGVNVANPGSGSYWILPSVDWLQEVEIGGLGANAEYGNFTGGILNAVTKSGGNAVSGDVTLYYTDESFVSNNTDGDAEEDFSNVDLSASIGGPLAKDSVWYFVSANAVEDKRTPVGALASVDRSIRRYMAKITWQADTANRIVVLGDYDGQNADHRGIDAFTLPSATRRQESPNYTYNVSWEGLVNASNFVAVKLTGFTGDDDRIPYHGDIPGRYDAESGYSWQNATFYDQQHYSRQTLDASWSLYADSLLSQRDSHSFKFGATYERGTTREDYWRNGGFSYYDDSYYCDSLDDYFADPECAIYSADFGDEIHLDGEHTGVALYAQDSLKVGRFTVNAGVRYGQFKGGFANASDDVYDVDFVDPRLGFVWDVRGDARTAVKAHYGRYHSGMFSYLYDREQSGNVYTPFYYCDYSFSTGEFDDCSTPQLSAAAMDPNIKHPYMDQWVATVEQQLAANMSLGLDYIHREYGDLIAMVNENLDYDELLAPDNPLTGGNLPFYDLLSPQEFVLTNPSSAYRDYDSLVLRFDKRYSDGWLLRASLVWADLKGNIADSNGYAYEFEDLNGQVNSDGRLGAFSKWEFKLSGSVDLPYNFEASAFYVYRTGEYWTPYVRVRGLYYNDPQGVNMVPRGSEQLPDRNLLDLRFAWSTDIGEAVKLQLFADVFNVTNEGTVTAVTERWGDYRYDYTDHPAGSEWRPSSSFGTATAIERPREIRLGARLSF